MNLKYLAVKISLVILGAGACGNLAGKELSYNYQVNSSFEYATNPNIPDFWFEKTVIGGLGSEHTTARGYAEFHDKWRLDALQYYDGKQSLSLEKPLQLIGSEMPIPLRRDEPIVASVYMKAERSGTEVKIGLGRRLDANRGEACISDNVNVGTNWERYQIVLNERNTDLLYFFVIPISEGRIWIDAVQIENGQKPGAYTASPRDEVFQKPFFHVEQLSAPLADNENKEKKLPLVFSSDFNNGKLPEGFIYKSGDWEIREGTFCRINTLGDSNVTFGKDDWDIDAIEFRFRLLKEHDTKQDAFLYINYGGATIRATYRGNVIWMDGNLYEKDKKAGMIIRKKELLPDKWYTIRITCRNNAPAVNIDGEFMLTGGPFAKKGGKINIGCWMIAAAIDDIKVYASAHGESKSINYQCNSGFEVSSNSGVPDFWYQKVLSGRTGEWSPNAEYAEFHPKWHIDTSQYYEGKNSLKLEKPLQLVSSQMRLPSGQSIIASAYMKAAQPETQVEIGFVDNSEKIPASTVFRVGTSWSRYEVRMSAHDTGLLRMFVLPQSEGCMWVDAVQVETGETATPYVDSANIPSPQPPSFTETILKNYKDTLLNSETATTDKKMEAFTEYSYYTGEKEARLAVNLNLGEETEAAYLQVDIISGQGEKVVKIKHSVDGKQQCAFVALPLEKCQLDGSPYDVKVTAYDSANVQLASAETMLVILPSAKTEVKTNRLNQGIYVNGEPFMPYATFQGILRKREDIAAQIAFFKSSGMNTVFFPGYWTGRDEVNVCLEEAARQNMRVLIFYDMSPRRKHDVREIFSWLKGKEAIIGVVVADEIGNDAGWVYDAVRSGKEVNPYILTFINHNVLGLKFFEGQTQRTPGDIYSIDFYPIASSLNFIGTPENIYDTEIVLQMLKDASISRHMPMNFWMQGGWAYCRCITPAETEWFNYMALVYGVKSFAYYIGVPQSKATWERTGRIGREFEVLKPAIFSLEEVPEIRPADSATENTVKFIVRKHQRTIYLVAVNRRMEKVKAGFDLSNIKGIDDLKRVEVLFEDRKIEIQNAFLRDTFGSLERHVYTIGVQK